jgi:glutamyl-tRNA(Gln) amidotransferase subunit E
MSKPEQIKEAALKIGEILRACKVKRGIGTIRQDVNISTKDHERVEIKGFQDPKMMIKTVDKEIERQQKELLEGKNEKCVRNALPDGSSEFSRPMPGRARMYSETDLPLLRIGRRMIDNLKKKLPKLKGEKRDELKKKGLGDDMIELVLKSGKSEEFDVLMKVHKNASLVGKMVTIWRTELEKKAGKLDVLTERVLEDILEKVENGEISEGDVKKVMIGVVDGQELDELVKGHSEKVDGDEVEEFVGKLVKEKPGMRENAYMGLVMKEFGGKVDAKKVMEIVKKVVGE